MSGYGTGLQQSKPEWVTAECLGGPLCGETIQTPAQLGARTHIPFRRPTSNGRSELYYGVYCYNGRILCWEGEQD